MKWWGRRTRWQQFLLVLMVVLAGYVAYLLVKPPSLSSAVFTVPISGGDDEFRTEGRDPAWSPDGSVIAFSHSIWPAPR
jgi:hypothetical protein